jgi:hypothetical protein
MHRLIKSRRRAIKIFHLCHDVFPLSSTLFIGRKYFRKAWLERLRPVFHVRVNIGNNQLVRGGTFEILIIQSLLFWIIHLIRKYIIHFLNILLILYPAIMNLYLVTIVLS